MQEPFLACGLCENGQQARFDQWGIVCQPLLQIQSKHLPTILGKKKFSLSPPWKSVGAAFRVAGYVQRFLVGRTVSEIGLSK